MNVACTTSATPVRIAGRMSKILYCRHPGCGEEYVCEAGKVPEVCPNPKCGRPALWSTEPCLARPWELSEFDRRLMRAFKIEREEE